MALLALVLLAPAPGLTEAGNDVDVDIGTGVVELYETEGEIELDGAVDVSAVQTDGEANDIPLVISEALDLDDAAATQMQAESEVNAKADKIPAEIELGVKEKYTLKLEATSPGSFVYKSTKSQVASVSRDGVITGKSKGTAQIKCYEGRELLGTCTVKVLKAPSKVSFGFSSISIGVKESVQLEPVIDKGARAAYTWSVKDKKIVNVSQSGRITGKKVGKTTVTVETVNGKRANLTVVVAKAPSKVSLDQSKLALKTGESYKLKAVLPSDSASCQITWSSSNKSVAVVDVKGTVAAVAEGKAVITAKTFNGRKATCAVVVNNDSDEEEPDAAYRALLIGQTEFYPPCERNRGDVLLMSKMLRTVKGLYGGNWQITQEYNLSRNAVLEAIKRAFGNATDDDVSLFFIATHGVSDSEASEEEAGALAMIPNSSDLLLMKDLANALKSIPGKIIVIIQSCGSGAALHLGDETGESPPKMKERANHFDQAVVKTFMRADPGVTVKEHASRLDAEGTAINTGEMRVQNKFYVLTASDYQEDSWGVEGVVDCYNLFTKWLTDGIGLSGAMQADTDRNGQITLNELYTYIAERGNGYVIESADGSSYYQHVQVYPSNSSFVLFTR